MIDATPMRRVGSPDEIGTAGAFLLSDDEFRVMRGVALNFGVICNNNV